MKLSKFDVNIERDREKEVEYNMWTLFLQLTQVLMSRIVDFILFLWDGGRGHAPSHLDSKRVLATFYP